ncbi:rRNA maturation RNase YbeY [Flavimaricola marinus]|nr:rRNA maturation RNase YbeY [Flavimaricola marinus]
MTVEADILIEDRRWADLGLEKIAVTAIKAVLANVGLKGKVEVSVLGCNDARIAALNADFRGKPQPTNVLSWPDEERGAERDGARPDLPRAAPGEPVVLGDIAIAYEICAAEAAAAGRTLHHHAAHLIVHGVLHLLGYDHERDADATLMEGIETEILGKMGIADPYRVSE